MFNNPTALLAISSIFAAIPVGIWVYTLFRKSEKSRLTVVLVFALGCLTAPALLGIQYVWDIFPNFNLAAFIENNIQDQNKRFLAIFLLFAAMEEIIKMYIITAIDKRKTLIQSLNDAMRYSFISALGFSFVENIYYLYQFWPSISTGALIQMYIFRSIFTTAAHMIFSGIFGYYYGVGKYAIQIRKQQELSGKRTWGTRIIAKLFNLPPSHAFQQKMVVKGLFFAIVLHLIYNYLLQFNIIIPVIAFVALTFAFLLYLLKRKTGLLMLETDITKKQKSSMAKEDEDVVIELIGIWYEEKRFAEVVQVCDRLLERDPDNKVVQVFRAKALDQIQDKKLKNEILGSVFKNIDH